MSIDGRISLARQKLPDWTSKEDAVFFQRSLRECDAVVVGRNTYAAAAVRLRRRTTYVFTSRVLREHRRGTVTFVNPKNLDLVSLFSRHKRIGVLGGAAVYRLMLERGLLHEFYVTIEPLLFGRGTPLTIGGTKATSLRLLSVRRLNTKGTLLLHYAV